MKCPRCGHWNKPSFPHCFKCGEPLTSPKDQDPGWQSEFIRPKPKKKRVVYDDTVAPVENLYEEPRHKAQPDENLAAEMTELKSRRQRGEAYQQDLRERSAEQGIAPSGANVSVRRRGSFFSEVVDDPSETVHVPEETAERQKVHKANPSAYSGDPAIEYNRPERVGAGLPQGYIATEDPYAAYDADLPPLYDAPGPIAPEARRRKRRKRASGPIILAYMIVGLLVLGVFGFLVYAGASYIVPTLFTPSSATSDLIIEPEVIAVDGLPAHRIVIPGEEGSQVYVPELGKSYVVVGGVASIDIPDYTFYDGIQHLEADKMDVSLSPTITRNGVVTRLEPIRYTINIPSSPLEVLDPPVDSMTVSVSIYNMHLIVKPGSQVLINGKDYTDTVSTTGDLYASPTVQAIGNNAISITVRAPYCRETNKTINLYREPAEIPLELNGSTLSKTSSNRFTVYVTTQPGATITMESPYSEIVDNELADHGRFSVTAKMEKIGNNTIRIRASYPGKKDAIVEHVVYYLPPASVYTPLAWALTRWDYNNLMNNIQKNIEKSQPYKCQGVITEILSESPQLAIMDTSTDGREQLVMLQNDSTDTWEVGKRYRVYADVSGVYNNMPRMLGRFTYAPDDEGK